MLGTVRPSSPVRVSLDRDSGNTWGVAGLLVSWLARLLVALVVTVWRAPLLAALTVVVGVAGWAGYMGRPLTVCVLLLVPGLLVALLGWVRPAWAQRLASQLVGQWLRVTVYRPRWATACLASGATARVGSDVHVPVLVRHTHARGRDVLTVRAAPGQTVADWQAACASLASTFAAHSVIARPGSRPGWVVLDVLRRDPLAGESTAPNPARLPASGGVELGRDEHGQPFALDPFATPHAGMQGATRSGKSSTCYTLLGALAHRPDVVVCGVDPSGLLLDPFTHGRGSAWIATGTHADDLDHAAHVLADLVALMDDRVRDLRAAGVDKLAGFTPGTPAVWVVLEEYPGLLAAAKALDGERGAKPGERLAPRLEAAVGRLVKEGAKVGVCVLVLAQRMSAEALKTDDRANLGCRVTLRVDNADAVAMLHDGLTRDQTQTVREFAPGVALVETPGVPLRRVRMHYTSYEAYRARVTAGLAAQTAPALGCDLVGEVLDHPTAAAARGTRPGATEGAAA